VKAGFVVRCRYIGSGGRPPGVGWLTNEGHCTTWRPSAKVFETEADAWHFAIVTDNLGRDEDGEYCWVEPTEET
jgi:hypothetical protein